MSDTKQLPDPHAPSPGEHAPQVVVRAGKTFVCMACGTLVEIPTEFVGQMVTIANPSPHSGKPKPIPPRQVATPATPSSEKPSSATSAPAKPTAAREASATSSGKKPSRAKSARRRPTYINHIIDGLVVPSGRQLDRAIAWVCFRLKTLDRQNDEITVLKQLLRKLKRRKPTPGKSYTRSSISSTNKPSDKLDRYTSSSVDSPVIPIGPKRAARSHPNFQVPHTREQHERGPPE